MFNIRYKKIRLIPSKSAARELLKYGLTIEDCKEILESGYAPRKRGKDTIEKWMDSGNDTYNVVIVKSYNYLYQEDVYLIKHVGKFTKKKLRRRKK
ncbi:hypothetical protein KY348_02820 [Candidatus Woesearchaeota archaeon]|nr:hypothetical protein [Candidatus Woesearchaeota archaeon]